MNSSQLFSGRAFVTKETRCSLASHKYKKLILDIIKDSKNSFFAFEVSYLDGNENYDCYILHGDQRSDIGSDICLKFSLDKNCKELIRESSFLKNNDSLFKNSYIASGVCEKAGNVRYLLSSIERSETIRESGRYIVLENISSFIFTLMAFSKTETERNFKEFSEDFFYENSISKSPKFLLDSIDQYFGLDEVKSIFNELKSFVIENYDEKILEKNTVCHGSLSLDNVITRDNLFKFINCNNCFKGNKLIDIAFVCVNFGLHEEQSNYIINEYIEALALDKEETKKEFEYCLKIVTCIVYTRILYSYIIESCVFLSERRNLLLRVIDNFSSSFYWLEKFDLLSEYRDKIKEILIEPILNSQEDVSIPPNQVITKDRVSSKNKIKKPKLNAVLKKTKLNKPYIELSWEKINKHSQYSCYVLKPNGSFKEYKDSENNNYIYSEVDVIGTYGVGVKTLGDDSIEDSDYDIITLDIFDI
ncbi:MAG: hypothetical protein HWN81_05870 [Candidatus Lokiarchaeota archaeon]|nr:hypothetical protein [Candidatus Lokiarchaeota archaeon]